jgi:hypothetical protein
MNILPQIVILSAHRANLDDATNTMRHNLLCQMLRDLGLVYNAVDGVYKGTKETSLLVVLNNTTELETISDFAFKNFEQESILYSDSNRATQLIFNNGTTQELGRLTQVTKQETEKLDSYTILTDSNNQQTYYATR